MIKKVGEFGTFKKRGTADAPAPTVETPVESVEKKKKPIEQPLAKSELRYRVLNVFNPFESYLGIDDIDEEADDEDG